MCVCCVCSEQVSAVGRSLVDRSVQYKYLNPNLVAVVTESTDALRRTCHTYTIGGYFLWAWPGYCLRGGALRRTCHTYTIGGYFLGAWPGYCLRGGDIGRGDIGCLIRTRLKASLNGAGNVPMHGKHSPIKWVRIINSLAM